MSRESNNMVRAMVKIIKCPKCGKMNMMFTRKSPIGLKCKSCGYFEAKPE